MEYKNDNEFQRRLLYSALECSSLWEIKVEFAGGSDRQLENLKYLLIDFINRGLIQLFVRSDAPGDHINWAAVKSDDVVDAITLDQNWRSDPGITNYEIGITENGRSQLRALSIT